jgi:Domain of unknown function (DUF4333)
MLKGKRYVLAVIVTVAAGGWLGAGCSANVSIGETPAVARHTVETEVATTLARQKHQPVPKVVCPGDLKAKVGTVMYCSLTAQGSTTTYPVKVQVNSTSGTQVHFSIEVSQTPGHFTAPG